jgi:hypothetical protein
MRTEAMERAKRWQELQKLAEEYRHCKEWRGSHGSGKQNCIDYTAKKLADAAEEYVLDSVADPDDSVPDCGEQ